MSNSYYNHGVYPTPNSPGSSAGLRAELELITDGFDKLPTLSGNGYKVAMVNSTGTALIASSALQALAITSSTIDSTPIGAITRAAGNFTNLSVNGTAGLGSSVTIAGGNIDGTLIGSTTPAAGVFTTLSATSASVNGSAVVTLAAAQTLTNKTLTAPVISSIVNIGTLTLPTATDTLIGRTTTDTLGNKTISGLSNTITNIGNASLVNSSITIGSTTISLGSSSATVAGLTLTSPIISSISNTGTLTLPTSTDTLVGRATTDTLTNKTISGASNTISNIANASLVNSSVTIGSTSISLGATVTDLAGLTSVTATTFTGSLSGNASTVTNGVYTNGTYADPSWITSLAGSKVSGNIAGNAANVTGTVAVANGGTGATTAAGARVNLLPSLTGNAGKVLAVNGGETDANWISLAGTGTVTSVAFSTGTTGLTVTGSPITTSGTFTLAGTLAVANGGTGSTSSTGSGAVVLATSPALVTPNLGTPSAVTLTNATGLPLSTGVSGSLAIANGGTGQTTAAGAFNALSPITATGDLIIGNGVNSAARLGIGSNGQVLTSNGTTASWQTPATGVSLSGNNTWTGTQTFTNSLMRLLGSSTGYTTFTSANSTVTNYTLTVPAVTGTLAVLGTAQSFTATQTFPASGIRLFGSSTGYTVFASANASATNYTLTFPARDDTVVTVNSADTLTNKTISGSANTITNVSLSTGVTGTLPVANGGTGVTTSTGTGSTVLSSGPTLTNPIIASGVSNTAGALGYSGGNLSYGIGGVAYTIATREQSNSFSGTNTFTGNVGIGASPTYKLDVSAGSLGTTLNSQVIAQRISVNTSNADLLEISKFRDLAGTDWTTAGWRLQEKVDSTWMGYLQFNGNGNQGGFSIGTGTSTVGPGSISERLRVDSSGNVGIGSASSGNRLEVYSANAIVASYGTGGYGAFYARGSGTNASYFFLGNVTSGEQGRITSLDGGDLTFSNTASATERFRISSTGAFGLSGANYGTAGQVLASNGSGSAPTWQTLTGTPTLNVVTGTTQSAVAGNHYVLTNASASTVTLPTSPAAGDIVWVTAGNGRIDNVIARNGQNIMSLAEDMTLNNQYATVQLRFINSTLGWRLI